MTPPPASTLRRLTLFEVLFDLLVVILLVQASEIASDDLTLAGLARWFLVLALAWWLWVGTTTIFRRSLRHSVPAQLLVAVLVLAFIVAALAVPTATGVTGDTFAWAAAIVVVARVATSVIVDSGASGTSPSLTADVVLGLVAALLLAGSTVFSGSMQQAVWGLALLVLIVSGVATAEGSRRHSLSQVSEHAHERFALFSVALLAAAVFKAVTVLSGQGFTGMTVSLGVFLGVSALSLSVLYGTRALAAVRPSPASRYVLMIGVLLLVAGVSLVPVGVRRAGLLEPGSVADGMVLAVSAGAAAAALLGIALQRAVTIGVPAGALARPRSGAPALVIAIAGALAGLLALAGLAGVDVDVRAMLLAVGLLVLAPAIADLAWPAASGSRGEPADEARPEQTLTRE